MKTAIIIGSGISGIAVALRLRKKGYDVRVFEASEVVGGKLGILENKGYRWDTGPSLFTMPHLVDELFTLFDETPSDHFNYHKKNIVCNYFWEDGSSFSAKQSITDFIEDASTFFKESPEKIDAYFKNSLRKYELTAPLFLDQSLHKKRKLFSWKTLKALFQLNQLDINKTLDEVNSAHFKDDKLIQLFNRFATYNGSSPYEAPGILSMIPTLEMQFGTYFPKGGMRSIIESLHQLSVSKGIQFHLNEKINSIAYNEKQVSGVVTSSGMHAADVVVSNMDIYYTYNTLLPKLKAPKKALDQEKSSSALIFYWGIKETFPELDLHNIFFSQHYKEEFNALFNTKELQEDPTIYINISSKEDSSHAPPGSENWFVMINVPTNIGQDWKIIERDARKKIIQKLNRLLCVDIASLIETETVLDPIQIENKTWSHQGSLYGSSSNSKYAAFLRHSNFSKQLNNLYFCGGSVHPGGGIPLCLKSAKIVANLSPSP